MCISVKQPQGNKKMKTSTSITRNLPHSDRKEILII